MPKVPAVSTSDLAELSEDAIQVTSLEVAHSKSRPVLSLKLGHVHFGQADRKRLEFALSPPAAARLSRLLAEAVEKYLHGDAPEASRTE